MSQKELLEFYRKKFEEIHKNDDKFREKLDKYLRDLIADRHELEADSLRKSEKISDLQKALVDLQLSCFEERERFLRVSAENEQLKKNEENLHLNIRHLLNATKEKDIRDRIIYMLEDPKVEVGYRHKSGTGTSSPPISIKSLSHESLKYQVQNLQSELDEHSKVCQNKSNVILEDCKVSLEKCREKLIQNEQEISQLQNMLQETKKELSEYKQASDDYSHEKGPPLNQNEPSLTKKSSSSVTFTQTNDPTHKIASSEKKETTSLNKSSSTRKSQTNLLENTSSKNVSNLHSEATNMHLNLIFLSKILNKVLSLLQTIQTTQIFIEASKSTNTKSNGQKYVGESDTHQLQNYIRQCTRLSFEISNQWKSLNKKLSSKEQLNNKELDDKLKDVESNIEELAVSTAEADLLTISLSRATFFDYLTAPKGSFTKFGVKEMHNHTKYTADVFKIERSLKKASDYVAKAVTFTEWVIKEDGHASKENKEVMNQNKIESSTRKQAAPKSKSYEILGSAQCIENRSKSCTSLKSTIWDDTQASKQSEASKVPCLRRVHSDPTESEGLTRQINKTLSKIKQIESGEYFKDNEFYKHLGEQISMLTQKLKDLYDEFNVNSVQDQFNEYSALTLSKLETIAKQSHDAVIAAEAQISAHRSNARNLSQKLRDTEDLLRESIHECLDLKQKLHHESLKQETEKTNLKDELNERLKSVSDFDELDRAVKEVTSKLNSDDRLSKSPSGPYECMYCKAGSGHKLCEEKIKELRSNNRKLATELKLLKQDLKEEKKISKMSQEQVEKATQESAHQSESLKNTLQSLESRNASLLEQLKLEKNRLKNLERFHRLEIEGFQTDVKNLKSKIQEIEKQLMKAVLIFEHDKKDLELLKAVHTTAQNSKQAVGSIKRLKAKLYELETDIKYL